MKGSDASWKNDVEPPPQLIEYSDDEEERASRKRKTNKRPINEANTESSTAPSTIAS